LKNVSNRQIDPIQLHCKLSMGGWKILRTKKEYLLKDADDVAKFEMAEGGHIGILI
jgi:hypothetical protein